MNHNWYRSYDVYSVIGRFNIGPVENIPIAFQSAQF